MSDPGPDSELARLRAELERLRESNAVKDKFLSIISHDLRNPMTGIKGYGSLLRAAVSDDKHKKWLNIMIEQIDRMTQFIADLLDLQRADEGRLEFPLERLDLTALVGAAVRSASASAAARGLALETELPAEPVLVAGNAERLSQVLGQLLGNALKFVPSPGRIIVRLVRAAAEARIEVEDSGPGIAPEALPYLFDKFQAAFWKLRSKEQGSGLGLPLARRLIEFQKGSLEVKSVAGQGACFAIRLPLANI